MPVRKWSWEPSYLTDIITCQIRKENPGQTLSDFGVNFHVVLPSQICCVSLRLKTATIYVRRLEEIHMSTTTTAPTTPTKEAPISLTPNAIAKVKGIMAQQN